MNMFELYKNYKYAQIKKYAKANKLELIKYGKTQFGENFLVLNSRETASPISFVLNHYDDTNIYTCIYFE